MKKLIEQPRGKILSNQSTQTLKARFYCNNIEKNFLPFFYHWQKLFSEFQLTSKEFSSMEKKTQIFFQISYNIIVLLKFF